MRRNTGGIVGCRRKDHQTERQQHQGPVAAGQQQNGGGQKRTDRHHGQRLDKHAGGRHRLADTLAAHQPGPQDNHHRLARHVFSEVPDPERRQRVAHRGRCPMAHSVRCQKIQQGNRPARYKRPANTIQRKRRSARENWPDISSCAWTTVRQMHQPTTARMLTRTNCLAIAIHGDLSTLVSVFKAVLPGRVRSSRRGPRAGIARAAGRVKSPRRPAHRAADPPPCGNVDRYPAQPIRDTRLPPGTRTGPRT